MEFMPNWATSLGVAYLGDFGAEIIKVESPEGDPIRKPKWVPEPYQAQWNYWFDLLNRNKKSLAFNLDHEEGKHILRKLIEKVDVFVTGLNREELKKLKLDYDILFQSNPKIIFAVCSGFGRHGPDSTMPAIDELAAARSGLMPILPQPGEPPVYTGAGDAMAGMCIAYGIMAAIYHQARTGEGQEVDASLFGANAIWSAAMSQAYFGTQFLNSITPGIFSPLQPISRKDTGNPLVNMYLTKDKWVYMALMQTNRYWHDFCQSLGIEEVEHDQRFDTHDKRCGDGAKELIDIIDKVLPQKTASEWLKLWESKRFPVDVVQNQKDMVEDEQVLENDYIIEVDHPNGSKAKLLWNPVQCLKTPAVCHSLGPSLGQHNMEILVDLLGYGLEEIRILKKQKVIL